MGGLDRSFLNKKKSFEVGGDYYSHCFFMYRLVFFGKLNFRGRKFFAFNLILKLNQALKSRELGDPSFIFLASLMNLTPLFFVRQFWVGGGLKMLPLPISNSKKFNFAVMYIFKILKQKHNVIKLDNLVELLVLSLYKRGQAYDQKIESHKKSSENRHLLRLLK